MFLAEVERWYDAVLPVLAARLQPDGGPIIGVQLDHEIGMLACDYPADLAVYAALLDRLGVRPRWRTDATEPGLVIAAMMDPESGAELVHLINVAPYPLTVTLRRDDREVMPESLTVPARGAELLRVARVGADETRTAVRTITRGAGVE